MATDYEKEVFRLIYKNMDYNGGFSSSRGNNRILMGLLATLLPIIIGALAICVMGIITMLKYGCKALYNFIQHQQELAKKRKEERIIQKKIDLEKQEQERIQAEQERAEYERELEKRSAREVYDSAVVQLRNLINQNLHNLQYSILRTDRYKYGKEEEMCIWVNFTVYDFNKNEVVCVNDLVNRVCYDMLKVSTKEGNYLKGSLIFPYNNYLELEDKLRTILQTCVTLTLA